jgi:ATP-dependent Clp protease ATP-binding subunit ClpX
MEEVLMDVMYELPSLEGVRKCIVTKDAASKKDRPILLGERGGRLEWHASSDRGAA